MRALLEMGTRTIPTVEVLLARLETRREKPYACTRAALFCLDLVLSGACGTLAPAQRAAFEAHRTGLRAMTHLSHELRGTYGDLVRRPDLLFETMVMDQRIAEVAAVAEKVPGFMSEEIALVYAKKALGVYDPVDVPPEAEKGGEGDAGDGADAQRRQCASTSTTTTTPAAKTTAESLIESMRKETRKEHLNGDARHDGRLRNSHRFPGVPNVNLAKLLLEFCHDPLRVVRTCLAACQALAARLDESTPQAADVVDVVLRVLRHGRSLVQRDATAEKNGACVECVLQCDRFIARAELFAELVRSRRTFGLSLGDMLEQKRVLYLRDRLVDADLMPMASASLTRAVSVPARFSPNGVSRSSGSGTTRRHAQSSANVSIGWRDAARHRRTATRSAMSSY